MAALVIENGERQGETIPLERGPNLLGRGSDCPLRFDAPSVSARHCELLVSEFSVQVRDLGSSNGTFVDGVPVQEGILRDGQILSLGDLRLRAVLPPVHIAIPELSPPEPAGPALTAEGHPACQVHRTLAASHVCTQCTRTFCAECVRVVRLAGGKPRLLCPACSHPCQSLAAGETEEGANSVKRRVFRAFRRAFDFRRRPRSPT
jgi:hypothetical protein